MQTFLPYPDFRRSAEVLDRQRLGKQRVETKQILRTLTGESSGWANHPAVKMWRGYEHALSQYGLIVCTVWIDRGYKDSLRPYFLTHFLNSVGDMPPWMGDPNFHISHQSNLLRKNPDYYNDAFPGVPNDIDYVWPIN